jgi:hypothetical protein
MDCLWSCVNSCGGKNKLIKLLKDNMGYKLVFALFLQENMFKQRTKVLHSKFQYLWAHI